MEKTEKIRFYDGATYKLDESIGYLMRHTVTLMSAVVEERMTAHGLTDAQWKPLLMIGQGYCRTGAELARKACCDNGAVTRLLDRVEAKGLVRRVRSQEDRRVVNLELTEAGTEVAGRVPYVLADISNTLLEGFSESEARTLQTLLQRLYANARALRDAETAEAADGGS